MNKILSEESKTNILIVDDTPENLHLLGRILKNAGYQVRPASNGSRALAGIKAQCPDLILLDIKMPDMSGYEVCERLKLDERTCDIPVIFISAMNQVIDKVRAFSLGGVDYITKPFHAEEVLLRVKSHLELCTLRKQLESKNRILNEEIREKSKAKRALQHLNEALDQKVKERTDELRQTNKKLRYELDANHFMPCKRTEAY